MNTLNLDQAASFLKMSAEDLRRKTKTGKIPGAKPGKAWVFLEEDLVTYLRSLYPPRGKSRECLVREVNHGAL